MDFEQSKTKENLARTFCGECQDGARYQFISKQAQADGYKFISNTLKTLAKNEMAHARAVYDLIIKYTDGKCKNIAIEAGFPFENYELPASISKSAEIELMEAQNIYTAFAKVAYDEGFTEAGDLLTLITEVENCHNMLLTEMFARLKSDKLYVKDKPIKWKCSNCGHEQVGKKAWEICPLCGYPQGYVMIDFADE